jgi:sec-independent protein translocase protein TatA
MFSPGAPELIVIGVIVLLIFGAKRLPEIGKGIGSAIREFRKVKQDISLNGEKGAADETKEEKESLENELAKKAVEEVPVLKKGLEIKKKAEKVKKILK